MSKSDSVPVAIDTALLVPTSAGKGDYMPGTVPQNVPDAVVKDGTLSADVLNAGAKVGTGLDDQEANDRDQIKSFRVLADFSKDRQQDIWQIHFAMDVSPDAQSVVFSDVESQGKPPKITSSDGVVFEQPTEGVPFPGDFDIKVRDRTVPSFSVIVVCRLELAAGTMFGQLLKALVDRHFEPFHFRHLGFAYLGCRDFISQATAAWLRDGLYVSGDAIMVSGGPEVENRPQVEGDIETEARHIFSLLGWHYTRPHAPANVSDADAETERSFSRTPNGIDCAVWGIVHIEDVKLSYDQGIIPTA
ncbi:hypothetical protein EDB92DRAFT_1815127 [Lactarius akahatsu]|uniref:Uncharacterized protein n=1 Tax=Lactarius akahatsu TaxID=416441 RepID=A0AAD4QF58_9AGAM|nr:hypothetical protein EDB92DRAFT_1815127 [Lactarius akahatsu]